MCRVGHILVLLGILVKPHLIEGVLLLLDLHRLVVLQRGRVRDWTLGRVLDGAAVPLDGNHALDFVFENVFQRQHVINCLEPANLLLLCRCVQMKHAVLRHQMELVPVSLGFQDALSDAVDA